LIQLRITTDPQEIRGYFAADGVWEWVLDELIWTFENHHPDSDGEAQFYDHSEIDRSGGVMEMVKSMKVDRDGLMVYQLRKENGFRLFGKYYTCLWS